MKIVRFRKGKNNDFRFGLLENKDIFTLKGDPLALCEKGERISGLDELELGIPCEPGKVIAAAMNYDDKPDKDPNMTEPLIFLKTPTSLCGSFDDIISPFSDKDHWGEPEIAVVMRKHIFRPFYEEIPDAVLGFTSANDVTAKNVDGLNHHLARSKAADTFCPLGYYIDTNYDFRNKQLKGFHEGHLLFNGNTRTFIWNPYELVYKLAQYMTLEPWDVILTGSPATMGELTFLKPGETFIVEIEGLPTLRNKFRIID